mgnify:FL=1|jgi:DNA polymerase I-like protein with 3'-5' exonuclease and polymerase domains|tara:strand:+ start:1950 stop:2969 length:1020 start_codon:yes stop_codon:yes gene_type:complete
MRNSCTYKIAGTKTFRLSSTKILGKWGGNLQNIEKSMRQIYVPDEGKIFCQVDQSGAEALIVAYIGEKGKFRTLFENNVKPHVYVALMLFADIWEKKMRRTSEDFWIKDIVSCPIPELKKNAYWKDLDLLIKDSDNWALDERYYYLAKQTCHSSNYGIAPPTFRMNILEKSGGKIVITKEDSERFISTYHSLFPEIENWHRSVQKQVEKSKMLYNLHGHPYTISKYQINETDWKELYAWVPQSTVGEITSIAYTALQQYIEQNKLAWDLLANTHDSYLIQCPIEEVKECAIKAKEFMEQEFTSPVDDVKFRMKSEAQVGFNWRPFKEHKNPQGLKEIKL